MYWNISLLKPKNCTYSFPDCFFNGLVKRIKVKLFRLCPMRTSTTCLMYYKNPTIKFWENPALALECSVTFLAPLTCFYWTVLCPDAGKHWRQEEKGTDNRGWDGWMASLTQWTWVWASSGSWRWTGKPGVLQSVGSHWVRRDWGTGLNRPTFTIFTKPHCALLLQDKGQTTCHWWHYKGSVHCFTQQLLYEDHWGQKWVSIIWVKMISHWMLLLL